VELPPGGSATALFDAALDEHILVAPGTLCSNTARCDGFLRINCGIAWSPALADGLRRLGELVRRAVAPDAVRRPAA
jgi:DNA-binding transcriptional MocR family regulator